LDVKFKIVGVTVTVLSTTAQQVKQNAGVKYKNVPMIGLQHLPPWRNLEAAQIFSC